MACKSIGTSGLVHGFAVVAEKGLVSRAMPKWVRELGHHGHQLTGCLALPAAVVQHPVATSVVILAGSSLLLSPYILLAGTAVVLLTGTKLLPGFLRPALPGPVSEVCSSLCITSLRRLRFARASCSAHHKGNASLAQADVLS